MRAIHRPAPTEGRQRSETSRQAHAGSWTDGSAATTAARNGDLNAWHWIVREHQESIFRSAYLATRDRALAVEATGAAFVRAYRALASLPVGTELRPWLMRLTDAIARARLREQSRQRDARPREAGSSPRLSATPFRLAPGTPTPTPADYVALADAFDGLAEAERTVIAARYAFGLARDAAATRLDVEPAEVDGLLAAAMSRLRNRAEASRFRPLSDDQIGSMTMAAVISELPWTPDVAAEVCDRLAREAVAYGVTSAASGQTSRHPKPQATSPDATTPRPVSRRSSVPRSLGLVAGASLLVVALVFVGGGAGQRGSDFLADVRASVEGLLGETSALPASAADDATAVTREPPVNEGTTLRPAAAAAVEPPAVDLVASMVGARRLENGSLRAIVRLDWPLDAERDAPVRTQLEQMGDDGTWSPLAWTDSQEPLLVEMEPGNTYGLRVRSVDASDAEAVSPISRLKLNVRKASSDRLVRSKGDWETRRGPTGQPRLVAVEPGARVSTKFNGTDVAVLGRLATSLGPVGIRVDGGSWVRDPEPIAQSGRLVLYREDVDAGRHSLDVRAVANGLAVDAFLILRSVNA